MKNIDDVDFFRSDELLDDPYPYFEALRTECPVRREPHHGVVHGHRLRRGASPSTTTQDLVLVPPR